VTKVSLTGLKFKKVGFDRFEQI